jgi:hypothetical protein
MLTNIQNYDLPPDHEVFVRRDPPTGRIIVIAPTRAACETIELAFDAHIETYLEKNHGERLRELARSGQGFGIVAGTGTGKTLAVRPIAEEILQAPLKVGVVNREREATPELPDLNVIVVTTGIARRWFQDGDILPRDTLVIDEIHQTSAELELCLALGKRVGCRFIWLSATVDPKFYRNYLNSADVLEVYSFDPQKAALVKVINKEPQEFFDEGFVRQIIKQKRGVGVFLPTRAGVEKAAAELSIGSPRMNVAYYHGGEPVRIIRPFLEEGGVQKPYVLTMTAAGQSALNVRGLDTVVIEDSRFANVIERGRNVLTRLHLGSNEMLQMAGRVHGRVEGGRVFILSDRDIDFAKLRPTAPEFQLAGDSERVALTCADLGVRADELELPIPLDKVSYRQAFTELQQRGIINDNGRLSRYGKAIEALPMDRAWAELVVNADPDMVPYLAVMSSIESLHRMTREERDLNGLIVSGSDHLTSYNLYAEAFERAGYIGVIHDLPRHLFESEAINAWAESRGVLVKSVEDAALATACVFRSVGLPLPKKMPLADATVVRRFTDLLAKHMPFDLAIDERTAGGQPVRLSKTSVCGSAGAIAGSIRYFADRFGVPRASIDGTQIRMDRLHDHARQGEPKFIYDAQRPSMPLQITRSVEYFGFVLDYRSEPVKQFAGDLAPAARRALAEALARQEAYHMAVKANRAAIEEIREMYRRSGGQTSRLGFEELTALYEKQLNEQNVDSLLDFRSAQLIINPDDFVPEANREKLWQLPSSVLIDGFEVPINYDVEEPVGTAPFGVAKLHPPEKLAKFLTPEMLPKLDRPLRFVVTRGQRGAVRANSLEELKTQLEGPWTPNAEKEKYGPSRKAAREEESRRPAPKKSLTGQSKRRPNFKGKRPR